MRDQGPVGEIAEQARSDAGPLCSERGVRARLAAAGLRPHHRLGQNFLCHPGILSAVVETAGLTAVDHVLEVGAGLGTLTVELARRAAGVVAVELDRNLAALLPGELRRSGVANVRVVSGDILALTNAELVLPAECRPFKVVANLPYYLTSPILERILADWRQMQLAVVMVQEEVARRLVAGAGSPDYGALSVFVQYHAQAEVLRTVPPSAFWPRPDVRSAVVRMCRHARPPVGDVDEETFFRVVRAAFGQRRKQIRNSLGGPPLGLSREASMDALGRSGLDGSRRAETVSLEEFAVLARVVSSLSPAGRR